MLGVWLILLLEIGQSQICGVGSDCKMHGPAAKRNVLAVKSAVQKMEGEGFPVSRPFPSSHISNTMTDPFLMLDHMGPVDYPPNEAKGAPWHPHRGFETVTYMLQGEFLHQDSLGNKGILRPGDIQWMTAGSGIIHHEVPSPCYKKRGGVMEGFQLWVNLPKDNKMTHPAYQDIPKDKIPIYYGDGYEVKVIAGYFQDKVAQTKTIVPIQYLDVYMKRGTYFHHIIPSTHNCFGFVYRGSAKFGTETVKTEQIALLGEGEMIEVWSQEEDVQFLLLSGEPIKDQIAQYGPFVMNTQEELQIALREYHSNTFIKHSPTFSSQTPDLEECL